MTNKGAVDGPPPVIVIDCGNHFRLDTLSSTERARARARVCVCVCVCVFCVVFLDRSKKPSIFVVFDGCFVPVGLAVQGVGP